MATAGQRPKPAALRLIEGKRGHRPIPEAEPRVEGGPVKPPFLKGKRAGEIWAEYVVTAHWLTAAESHALAVWCQLTVELERSVKNTTAARIAQWRSLSSELGLNPPARARLGTTKKPEGPKDPAEKYF